MDTKSAEPGWADYGQEEEAGVGAQLSSGGGGGVKPRE